MNNEEFVNAVWSKYNNYMEKINKEKFFKKHQYKYTEIIRKITTAIGIVFGMIATTGIVYAGMITHQTIQKSTKTNFYENLGYYYDKDMTNFSDGIYYKKIYTYNEYMEAQKIWKNLVEMKEEDFEDNFVFIIAGEHYENISLYISNIMAKNEKLYIELKKNDEWNGNSVISTKIAKELDRQNVEIKNIPNIPDTSEKYVDMKSLNKYYTAEQAIADGCFTIKENKVISNDKQQLDKFIENCNNGIEDVIRIYNYGYFNTISVTDIEYKKGKINVGWCYINLDNKNMHYYTGNKLVEFIEPSKNNEYINYFLENEIGEQRIVCLINNL